MQSTIKLNYEERGTGLPVLLIHGFPFDHTIWRAQIDSLSDSYRIIAPDLRGHGQSPVPNDPYLMDIMARDLVELLDTLGIDKAVWVGHSMGGYITMAALRDALDRILSVALVATHPLADPEDRRIQRLASAETAEQTGSSATATSMMAIAFAPQVDRKSNMAQNVFDIMAATSPIGIAGALRGMAQRPDSLDTLRNISVPAIVMGGTEDQIVKPDLMQQMAADMPHTRFVTIDGAGHLPMLEKPDEFSQALRRFLNSLAG
ncbi:MAG TPA: alpha/beta hydrolase [Aggregatilineaceae bacterium]|nr:alpha/beta hydrolase [Aggregatilineaceae bacterium]